MRRIEDLADGICYCLLINHKYGNRLLSEAAINRKPKDEQEVLVNLRLVKSALTKLKIYTPVDVKMPLFRSLNWLDTDIRITGSSPLGCTTI